ncbi:flagellin B [Helicobacter monodelphidis]|uniref:flagellin B n=1 Tax=Helicobacter sp. 15-1451 TaxID=2004995 RepID=UPI000DCCA126|nr:flagellin B [Helicobacter sp. 15-1451]RAX58014.1 flagellin B [Helicobacter sp. 15-1451]
MGFVINTNVASLNGHAVGLQNGRYLDTALERLSSGYRINKAADDASGMAIADSLRSQASSLVQATRNANDAVGMIQIADKAMDEQIKILDSVKAKAVQAAQDGQTSKTRKALQSDILRLLEELDNIANTTSYNGQEMLSGAFTNKEFQIGAYSNTTVRASIGPTNTSKIGHVRFETSSMTAEGMLASTGLNNLQVIKLRALQVDGINNVDLESVRISTSAGTGLGALAEVINKNSNQLGFRASYNVEGRGSNELMSGTIRGLVINGVTIGDVIDVQQADRDGRLIKAINDVKEQTGVEASIDVNGRLTLTSTDGRAIAVNVGSVCGAGTPPPNGQAAQGAWDMFGGGNFAGITGGSHTIVGRLTLTRHGSRDIRLSGTGFSLIGMHSAQGIAQQTVNLRQVRDNMDANLASAIGANGNIAVASTNFLGLGAGVTSLQGAMAVMDMAESATLHLDMIRADLGSVQQQLVATINNITITQVNVKAAESNIRDADFAEESSTFTKHNILAQSGSFALAQANQVQQNVLKLLQ